MDYRSSARTLKVRPAWEEVNRFSRLLAAVVPGLVTMQAFGAVSIHVPLFLQLGMLEVVEEHAVVHAAVHLHERPVHVRLEDSLCNMKGAQVGAVREECF